MKHVKSLLFSLAVLLAAGTAGAAMLPGTTEEAPGFVTEKEERGRLDAQYLHMTEGSAVARFRINATIDGEMARFDQETAARPEARAWTRWYVGRNGAVKSILLAESTYYDRAAHPTTYVKAFQFDENGNRISRETVLKKVETDPPKIRALIYAQTKEQNISLFDDAVEALTEWPKEWYIGNDGTIYFIFQQYDIAPYAAGWIEIAAGRW